MGCPIKTSSQFKNLSSQIGSYMAIYTWKAYGEVYPTTHTNTQLRQTMGISYKAFENQIPTIAKKVRRYNVKHGTSHSFIKARIGDTSRYDLKLEPNYLPVNIERQRQKDEQRSELDKTFFDNENLHGVNEEYISDDVHILGPGQFMTGGEIYPSYTDALDALDEIKESEVVETDGVMPSEFDEDFRNYTPSQKLLEYLYEESSGRLTKDSYFDTVKQIFNVARATRIQDANELYDMIKCI